MSRGAMKRAGLNEPTPAGMELVQVIITGSAQINMFMPTGMADVVDENDPEFADEVVEAAGVDLFTDLDFEVDVLGAAPAAKKKGNG